MRQFITGATFHDHETTAPEANLELDNGIITHCSASDLVDPLDYPDHYIIPGMIDMHIHGSNGCDVMDANFESLQTIADSLLANGTTQFLATTMTGSPEAIEAALVNVAEFQKQQTQGAKVLGVHLEGPFLAPEHTGAQRKELLCAPNVELLAHWQDVTEGIIKMVTVAPERPGSEAFIKYCHAHKIIVSFGHSNADYAQTEAAIDAGVTHATHLFNAMRGIHHRRPGAVTALLLRDEVYAELITDGHHVAAPVLQLALKMKGPHRLILVTDAMRAQCMPKGEYELGGQPVLVDGNTARLADGTLAGSIVTLPLAMRYMQQATDCSMNDLVKFTSHNAAEQLGVPARGAVLLDKDFQVVKVFS